MLGPAWRDDLPPKFGALWSYAFLRKFTDQRLRVLHAVAPWLEWLIDSGAYTDYHAERKAKAAGRAYDPIRVGDYVDWLRDHRAMVWQAVALDVLHNFPASVRNTEQMVARGVRPMPVVTTEAPLDAVPDLVAINPWLCVAGGSHSRVAWAEQRFARVFTASDGTARIHGLGYVKSPSMYAAPIASADSSSWGNGQKFGLYAMMNPSTLKITSQMWSRMNPQSKRDEALRQFVLGCDVPPALLRQKTANTGALGVPSVLYLNAYVVQQQLARQYRLRIFPAINDFHSLNLYACVVWARAGRTDARVSVPKVQQRVRWLQAMGTNSDEYAQALAATLREAASRTFPVGATP